MALYESDQQLKYTYCAHWQIASVGTLSHSARREMKYWKIRDRDIVVVVVVVVDDDER